MYRAVQIQNKRRNAPIKLFSIHLYHKSVTLAIALFSACLWSAVAEEGVLQSMEREFQAIVKSVQPSVVEVVATCRGTPQTISGAPGTLLTDNSMTALSYENIGSGIIINAAGHIVTTAGVVENATEIEVVFTNGKRTSGTLLGIDALTDIAVLSVENDNLPQTRIGDSDQINTGSWVITVGSSYGHSPTLSFGTVSGLEILPDRPFYDAIKVNASVNPGNSGGAVVNTSGEIVGVIAAKMEDPYLKQISHWLNSPTPELLQKQTAMLNTSPFGQTWTRSEVGFAIPINTVKHIAEQLTQYGSVPRGRLGVWLEQEHERTTAVGVRVTKVSKGSPAEKSGIKNQDVIVEFKGQPVRTFLEFKKRVASFPPDTRITVKIYRDGQFLLREVVLGNRE
ncbi:PDZ domain-containing protein [Candidatus Poribacteria bacterium]|nr:PDZ domain-containing protein [Candidatus Poribacteria bacterium]